MAPSHILHEFTMEDIEFPSVLARILPDTCHLGLDDSKILQKLTVGAAILGVLVLVIYLWTTVLVIKLRGYQVNLYQVTVKISNVAKENTELEKKYLLGSRRSANQQKIKEMSSRN